MRYLCVYVVTLLILVKWKTVYSEIKQERATIDVCNTKYVKTCYALTRRPKRGEPYKTNLTINSRYLSDDNVTMKVVLFDTIPIELMKIKVCEIPNVDWLYDYVKKYSNINGICPFPAGLYALYNLDFPPKNFPRRLLNLINVKLYVKFYFQVTNTEEIIVECTIRFHVL